MHRVVGATPASLVMAGPLSIQCIFIFFCSHTLPLCIARGKPSALVCHCVVLVLIIIPLYLIFMYIMMTKST